MAGEDDGVAASNVFGEMPKQHLEKSQYCRFRCRPLSLNVAASPPPVISVSLEGSPMWEESYAPTCAGYANFTATFCFSSYILSLTSHTSAPLQLVLPFHRSAGRQPRPSPTNSYSRVSPAYLSGIACVCKHYLCLCLQTLPSPWPGSSMRRPC
jgi:hypothetical protein